ncbi:type III-B CRISPR module-associated protein Cmr3 [Skermanella sp. TT6]|uniref:Type III-B CRISPR module-associated protein Cmr3 n=1 Tax=Skermanella cutis TaxID=2775420 RepID=A0ABX7BF19_9PROT|nr:type III-B CRISPR module-associated protein Cmr3 [Skermanella sp. TT6]QQP92190.1 type III-B CRISPR module-associated protein Cmr3 [Skermanella sp. TT6]
MTETTLTLYLTPLDLLFFRDGRSFDAGARLESGLPMPQTLAGALRSHLLARLGCDFRRLTRSVQAGQGFADALAAQGGTLACAASMALRGPWLALDGQPVVPTPSTLHREKGGQEIFRLDPLDGDLPGWTTAPGPRLHPLWMRTRTRTEPAGGFVTLDGLRAYLDGGVPGGEHFVKPSDLFQVETRSGIAVSGGSNTAAEGMIFTNGFLRLEEGVGFIAEVAGLTPAAAELLREMHLLRWGGEGRHVACEVSSQPIGWPSGPVAAAGGPLAVLTTPAFLAGGWHGRDWKPLAASVGPAPAVSGWDLALDGPKATRFLAPAGSVYFFRRGEDGALGSPSLHDGEDGGLGYGCFVTGGWNYA